MEEEQNFICPTCDKKFSRKYHLARHSEMHRKPPSSKVENSSKKCKFCPCFFSTNAEYLLHIETTHQGNSGSSFMCSDCGKQYKTKSELNHHIKSKCGTLKQFTCKVCGQELMSAGSLYNHMLRHNNERSFMCRFCAKLFCTAGQLKVHERIHTQEKAYVCEICNKGFCHRQSLITHSTLHTGIKPFQCENCGNSFSCVGNLIKHRRTHADTCGLIPLTTHRVENPATRIKVKINTPANSKLKTLEKNRELERELCILKTELGAKEIGNRGTGGAETSEDGSPKAASPKVDTMESEAEVLETEEARDSDLEESIEVKIEIDDEEPKIHAELNFSEEELREVKAEPAQREEKLRKRKKKTFDSVFEQELKEFIDAWNLANVDVHTCKFCKKSYSTVRWLYKHVKKHQLGLNSPSDVNVPSHKCSCCKEPFSSKEECLQHQQTTHADILTCFECERIFANRDSLRSHLKIFHRGATRKVYLYICEKCGKQFKQKSYLSSHETTNCVKGPFYECPKCQKQFTTKHTRNNHMRIHDDEKKLLCKFCAKSFHWKGQLKIHERSHTGEKPFTCLYCPKAFAYRESLMTHSTIHTGIKPHLCEGCGSRFSCIGNLIKHRITHAAECGAWTYKTQKAIEEKGENARKVS